MGSIILLRTSYSYKIYYYLIVISFSKISDCRRGQSLVVWAISEGRQAAREIDQDLMGVTGLPGPGGIISGVLN